MRPDTIVFDVGNVLIHWDPRHLYRKLIPHEPDMEHFPAHVATGPWNVEQDRGRSFAEGVALLREAHPDHAPLIEAFDHSWQEMVPGPIVDSVEILERLRAGGVPLYAITNFSAEKWAECLVRFPFLGQFRDVVVSAHERMLKPEPEIYHILLRRNALSAGQCVFIDDSFKNVEGARAVGMHALHFTNAAKLAGELRELGFAV